MKLKLIATLILLLLITLVPRVSSLSQFTTADEPRWKTNVAGFTRELAHGKINRLQQQPHPGITTQWLGSLTVRHNDWQTNKIPLVIAQGLLILTTTYIAYRLWNIKTASILTLALALNPFLIAHTRVYAMDSLLAHFLLLSLLSLLLWHKEKSTRYLIFSASAAAAAILSKLPGILIIPFTLGLLAYWRNTKLKPYATWLIALALTLIAILPNILADPVGVFNTTYGFLTEGHHANLHASGPNYYLYTLLFQSTPLHIAALMLTIIAWPRLNKYKQPVVIFLLFAVLFTVEMSLSAKKGDRYILPTFLMLDTVAALVFTNTLKFPLARRVGNLKTGLITAIVLLVWQGLIITQIHPYELSYVNPITKPLFKNRRLGWGEGLDLAGNYLNSLPDAENIKVASYYPTLFNDHFNGETIPLNHFNGENADYIVLYRAMLERGENSWEQDLLDQFATKKPAKLIKLNGLEYAWIHKTSAD